MSWPPWSLSSLSAAVLSPPQNDADELFQFEEEEAGDGVTTEANLSTIPSTGGLGRKRLFSKELRCMMYGFGDDQNPYTESVDLLEDLVIEFITQMVSLNRNQEIGQTKRFGANIIAKIEKSRIFRGFPYVRENTSYS